MLLRQVVFVATDRNGERLWLRRLDVTTAQPLPDTDGAGFAFWAPDGRSNGFTANGKLNALTLAAARCRPWPTSTPPPALVGVPGAWTE